MPTASEIIKHLNLQPHPEKGYYRQTFIDDTPAPPSPSPSSDSDSPSPAAARPASTCIYYLLPVLPSAAGAHWHRVLDAVEIWHYYSGSPLELSLSWDDGAPVRKMVLGPDVLNGQQPQVVVQKGEWQHARCLGDEEDWSLVGCTVAPGFRFEGFEMREGWVPRGA